MEIAVLLIFLLCLFGLVASLTLAKPIERMLTERSGIAGELEKIAVARKALAEAKTARTASDRQVSVLDGRQRDIERRVHVLNARVMQMVVPEWELIFELGSVEVGCQPYEFSIVRPAVGTAQSGIRPVEDALFAAPRRAQAWARTEQAAAALVLGRFPNHDGFVIYPKDRSRASASEGTARRATDKATADV